MSGPRLGLVAGGHDLRAIVGEVNFGFTTYVTAALPDRLWVGAAPAHRPAGLRHGDAKNRVRDVPTPVQHLHRLRDRRAWAEQTRATLDRLESLWLIAGDPNHLLDSRAIEPLAHQASLVQQVLTDPSLQRVLIADEVGLGKTIEAALIIQRLLQGDEGLKVLYLTESRLVRNVVEEFRRLDLHPRSWSSQQMDARLGADDSDSFVIGSMHLAVATSDRRQTVRSSGPWDVILIDEAHHLSDYSSEGHDPRRRMQLVRDLIAHRLKPNGRLILMTATPHQGHLSRYKNLLRLLSRDGNDENEARGRVIYRIKEDITDWDHRPLFPVRRIHAPTEVHVDREYTQWLESIRAVFTSGTMSRAAGWRRAQALQWAASSPQAGVAYLARFALRCGLDPETTPELKESILALRPFRGGPTDEAWSLLHERFCRSSRIEVDSELAMEDEDAADSGMPALPHLLLDAIVEGTQLVHSDVFDRKLARVLEQLEASSPSKLVVFAQPVETVWAIKQRLEELRGSKSVSIIVGGQDDDIRRAEIDRFWELEGGSEILVSSRSGGEGINLQVSNRLVHFDVPWNPMELEQRVGRIHRYGSVNEIHVHTLVVSGSRELRVMVRAQAKLAAIARTVGWDDARRDQLFGRTMSQIPWEELSKLMVGESLGPLSDEEEQQLQALIQDGFDSWRSYDENARKIAVQLQEVDRGPLRDSDLEHFLVRALGAREQEGWGVSHPADGVESQTCTARVFELPSGEIVHVGPRQGVSWIPPEGEHRRPTRVGLNSPWVANRIRELAVGSPPDNSDVDRLPEGTGLVQLQADGWEQTLALGNWEDPPESMLCVFALVRHLRTESGEEIDSTLACRLVGGSEFRDLKPADTASLMRILRQARPAQRALGQRFENALEIEDQFLETLRNSPSEDESPIVVAVFPIAAIALLLSAGSSNR